MSPKITVVTPSYNQAQYLEETIRSVVSQREHVHEYFVLDGGSTDGSVEIIKKYERQIDGWVSEKDGGQAAAIVKGFQRATGDVIAWLNSDDLYLPQALGRVQAAFARAPELDLLTGYMAFIDRESRILEMHRVPAPSALMRKVGLLKVTQPTTFFRRAFYERVGGLDPSLHCCMDTDLWSRFYQAQPRWGTLPQYIVGFRRHEECKGGSEKWRQQYADEHDVVVSRYPWLARQSTAVELTRRFVRLGELTTIRKALSMAETRFYRGRPVTEVFPPA